VLVRFLEFSIATADIRASLEFYAKLGFVAAPVGDAWPHPYAALTDGRLCLGLHEDDAFVSSTTFVRPALRSHVAGLDRLGVVLEVSRLAEDVFNEVAWFDPAGNLIRLVEARTFSPIDRSIGDVAPCGYFVQIGLPAAELELTKAHWEQFGFVGIDQPDAPLAHVACTSDGVDIGLYEPADIRAPTLIFEVDDCAATLRRLLAAGIVPSGRVPAALSAHAAAPQRAAQLRAPEGTVILLTSPAI
jgi:catechol 2,3-dioxygenase-like lactoylglutathione lyase family enzyme